MKALILLSSITDETCYGIDRVYSGEAAWVLVSSIANNMSFGVGAVIT